MGVPSKVVIIGCGISGICAGILLKQAGIDDIVILEKADRIGGTWRDNTYPGAACDIPAHLYSYSFATTGHWPRKYATQPEILAYLNDCVGRFDLGGSIRFGAEVVEATYEAGQWHITLADGGTLRADILITACGQLHRPFIPDIAGHDTFAGTSFHTAQWRHDCDLKSRAVAIIGSAASAVQIANAISWNVARLTIFQRTPNWFMSHWDRPYPRLVQMLFSALPPVRRLYRWLSFLFHELFVLAFRTGSLSGRLLTTLSAMRLRRSIADERLRAAMTPDYPFGCKRVLRVGGYLRLFKYDTNSVVAEPIERLAPYGIVTRDGRVHPADVIIYATGFRASAMLAPMTICGRGGVRLADAWARGAEAYLGMTVPGFPNFFMLYGPNTNLGHNSAIFMIECQVRYVIQLLKRMRSMGAAEIEPRPQALARFSARLKQRMGKTVWAGGCRSFYQDETGRVVIIWPFSTVRYWWLTRRPRLADYLLA